MLNKHFKNEDDAKSLVHEIEKVIDERFEQESNRLAVKEDLAKLETKMAENKTDMIKWMVGFWLAQMAAIIGLYMRK